GLFIVAPDETAKADAPGLRSLPPEPQATERDGKPHDVAIRRQVSVRFPYGIKAVVVVLPFRHDAVELHTQRVGPEHIGAFAIVEGVQVHGHLPRAQTRLRSEEHTSELRSRGADVRRRLLAKKKPR